MEKVKDIIRELRVRNYNHFDTFYSLTKQQVFFAIYAIVKDQSVAEDLLQDTYMRFLEKIDHFKDGYNPVSYMTSIGRNLAFNYYNEKKKEIVSDDYMDMIPAPEEETEDDPDILALLDLLTQDEREIVVMHVINDLKFREIAEVTQKPLGTVLWIYNKAMKYLKEKVGESRWHEKNSKRQLNQKQWPLKSKIFLAKSSKKHSTYLKHMS
ncbi:MAG: RNA polymerase sigma factor [Acholeplasma sp.]|nr:MAG: RNA polymerase sigma factor [Acholeplasma sp.]